MSDPVPPELCAAVRAQRGGWRLRNAPGCGWSLLGWVVTLAVAAVLQVVSLGVMLLPAAVGSRLSNPLVLIPVALLALAVGSGINIGGLKLGYAALRFPFRFHRLDLRLDDTPPRIVATGWARRSVIRFADLTGVFLRQYDSSVDLVLRAGNRTVVCPATVVGALYHADPQVLAGWLGEVLARWEVPVRHYRGWLMTVQPGWFTAAEAARLLSVPVDDLYRLADRHGIHANTELDPSLLDAYAVEEYGAGRRDSAETAD